MTRTAAVLILSVPLFSILVFAGLPATPATQTQFVSTVAGYAEAYRTEKNELKRSAIRTARRNALATLLPGRSCTNWLGRIRSVGTSGTGMAHVRITIEGCGYTIGTWNNRISDVGDHTLIEQSSPVFAALSNLSRGDLIVFSADFLPGQMDYLRETSATERGAMCSPDFLARITAVAKAAQ